MEIITVDALVVGTGAAGYQAACRLWQAGIRNVAMVTEAVNGGTSRNTGSDKQTYYKLGLGGEQPDSVRHMAEDLFACGATDGDTALCEAALSSRCFLNLCELGVPFPCNRYGAYVGYKTDHDPCARATSAGPLTSKYMTEALERLAGERHIPVYDGLYAAEILKTAEGVCGLLCLEEATGKYVIFHTGNLVLATGGPAGIYADSVYPVGHTGSSSLAFLAGAAFQNMTEWQYGLASVNPRWNVSGTYMQVLPRFVSVDDQGTEREFLLDFFEEPYQALSAVFLKGYQWPFDSSKVLHGSSVIDLLVYRESVMRGRRVYLDYRKNPFGLETLEFDRLSKEAREYLERAGACFGTPLERLLHMNTPAVELYRSKGVELTDEPLEIALCAQHCNGGIAVDLWWQSSVPGLFAVGECAGTHGITRPGGSALNAGQVGALRAATYIARHGRAVCPDAAFRELAENAWNRHRRIAERLRGCPEETSGRMEDARRRMSAAGAAIRKRSDMETTLAAVRRELAEIGEGAGAPTPAAWYRYRDALVCQLVCLSAMMDYDEQIGQTRGSALYYRESGEKRDGLEECFRFCGGGKVAADRVQQGVLEGNRCRMDWRPVRPLPEEADVFETVWRGYRETGNVW